MEQEHDYRPDKSEESKGSAEQWKLEFYTAQGWMPGKGTPEKAKKALAGNVKSLGKKTEPGEFAAESLDKELSTQLSGVKRTGAAKALGDKDYKMYMETVELHLAPVW